MTTLMMALATLNPDETAKAADYSKGVQAILAQYGGKPSGRFPITEQLLGEHSASALLQVEFENKAAIDQFLSSSEYRALIPLRDKGFSSMQIYVSEV